MQVLQAGQHRLILLELDPEFIANIIKQAGFEFTLENGARTLTLDVNAPERRAPLLLFDAADPGNLGWFSRCQFYIDGHTGNVLQTPISIGNVKDRSGHVVPNALRIQIGKELPAGFRLPGKQPVSEQMIYAVLYNLLNALMNVGVGVCGSSVVKPLAGRTETFGTRN
jgi:hypothetical protein